MMDSKEAIAKAKEYLAEVYAGEGIEAVSLEEVVHDPESGRWVITLAFSRPWTTPRTRAQEMLENLGAASPQRRSAKAITLTEDGIVLSMKTDAVASLRA